ERAAHALAARRHCAFALSPRKRRSWRSGQKSKRGSAVAVGGKACEHRQIRGIEQRRDTVNPATGLAEVKIIGIERGNCAEPRKIRNAQAQLTKFNPASPPKLLYGPVDMHLGQPGCFGNLPLGEKEIALAIIGIGRSTLAHVDLAKQMRDPLECVSLSETY